MSFIHTDLKAEAELTADLRTDEHTDREKETGGPGPWDTLVQQDPPPGPVGEETRQPFGNGNSVAVPTNQRSPDNWTGYIRNVDGANPSKLCNRQVGRKSVLIAVPTDAPVDVYVDSSDSVLQSGGGPLGFRIQIGASLTIDTEGPVWAIGNGADSTCSVIVTWDSR